MTKEALKKTPAWIFDAFGGNRSGMLEVRRDEAEGLRPGDKTWRHLTTLPSTARPGDAVRVVLWADSADKYIARIDIGTSHRWLIMEGLPAFLVNVPSFNSLIQLGRGEKRGA